MSLWSTDTGSVEPVKPRRQVHATRSSAEAILGQDQCKVANKYRPPGILQEREQWLNLLGASGSGLDGRRAWPRVTPGGKSGLHRTGWSVTPTSRETRESAAENRPPMVVAASATSQVRVKRCGKSAPAVGATRLAWQTPPGARPSREQAAFGLLRVGSVRYDSRVGCSRRRVIGVLDK